MNLNFLVFSYKFLPIFSSSNSTDYLQFGDDLRTNLNYEKN